MPLVNVPVQTDLAYDHGSCSGTYPQPYVPHSYRNFNEDAGIILRYAYFTSLYAWQCYPQCNTVGT